MRIGGTTVSGIAPMVRVQFIHRQPRGEWHRFDTQALHEREQARQSRHGFRSAPTFPLSAGNSDKHGTVVGMPLPGDVLQSL
jgi:hypothetical protein